MQLCHPAMVVALVAIRASLCPHGALAAERGCPGPTIEADAGFRRHWPDWGERIQSQLAARVDVDACARVELRLESDSVITVSVSLRDGRAASRRVVERDDVVPVLQALLLVPDLPAAPAAPSPPTPAVPGDTAFVEGTARTERDELAASTGARSLGVELSLITGARMGDGQLGVGVGALSFLEHSGWLLGFEGRADSYRALGGGPSGTALELAILAGRRLDLGSVALDLVAGPAVVMEGLPSSQPELQRVNVMSGTIAKMARPVQSPDRPVETSAASRSGPVPRLLLGARLGFSPHSVFRSFVGIDGEVGPALASSDPSSARLPGYSLGFSLGATLGTP
jgi:hypothetical protein